MVAGRPKRLPITLEMESGAPNGLPIALEMESGAPNGLPITLEMESGAPDGLPITLEMESGVPNGLPITLEMEFGRPATISNVFRQAYNPHSSCKARNSASVMLFLDLTGTKRYSSLSSSSTGRPSAFLSCTALA